MPSPAPPLAEAVAATVCAHCGSDLPAHATDAYCCQGCRTVAALLQRNGLTRYYQLSPDRGVPAPGEPAVPRDLKWLEPLEARVQGAQGACRLDLDVQGIHCAACVWLLEETFRRKPGALRVLVNPARGRAEILVSPEFPLREYVRDVEPFGYLFGPPARKDEPGASPLLTRIGVSFALAINSMIFALPIYFGLREGAVYQLFRWITFGLTVANVIVGGAVFVKSAALALRRRLLHLDLPIALGIVLAFSGSAYGFFAGNDAGSYFDTLNVFIALMLVGRWLQERVLERNRHYVLASDGVDAMLVRRVRGAAVELVACRELRTGDGVLVAPGDLVPVDAVLSDERADFSLDWISGESAPREFGRGSVISAGAFNAGSRAVTLRAQTDFEQSPLPGLLRSPTPRGEDAARTTRFWQRLTVVYVTVVFGAAVAGFAGWWLYAHDLRRALEVATAVLIVTCPCAFGIATPLAYELTQAGLRRAGLFVRSSGFLDRAREIRRVVFDKTGTLTTGVLELADPAALDRLSGDERRALYNLVVRSTHPKSVAVRRALGASGLAYVPGLQVDEVAGRGLELSLDGRYYRLGAAGWAAAGSGASGLVFAADGRVLAALDTVEAMRPDAAGEVARLTREGYEVSILSGDAPERVADMADALGLSRERAVGGQTPEGKSAWLAARDPEHTLMIGDGINDALAVQSARCSGTPAIDRPFMPARTDFFFVTAGLRPVGLALRASRGLFAVVRRNLAFAVVYNAGSVALALAGLMSPLLCAVLMPISSVTIVLATVASLREGSSLWKY